MKVVLAHPGTQHAFKLASELNRSGTLLRFVTCFALTENSFLSRRFRSQLKRRILDDVPPDKIKTYPSLQAFEFILRALRTDAEKKYFRRNSKFQDKVISNDLYEADVVIGFDTSSWKLAQYCAGRGKRFVLDVSIGHPVSKERIFHNIRQRFPDWTDIAQPKDERLIGLEKLELDLATQIVVPSQFVKRTLTENGVDPGKIFINPFGTNFSIIDRPTRSPNSPITFLFFGTLSARKGLPLLLEAWREMEGKNCRLLIAGYGHLPDHIHVPENVEVLGPILPGDRIRLFSQADVFVLPSYFEGFAQVQIEAAACGLPVIGSSNSGAEEIVNDGSSGFVIEPGNRDQLVHALAHFISNPDQISIMTERIRSRMNYFSWSSYGDRWNEILLSV